MHASELYLHVTDARKPRWASLRIAPRRGNLAGPRSELHSARCRSAKTSLGIAPKCFRSAPEAPKPRWASLQIAFGALPKRPNLVGHRSKLLSERSRNAKNLAGHRSNLLSERSRNAKTSLGIAQNCTESDSTRPPKRFRRGKGFLKAILRGRQSVLNAASASRERFYAAAKALSSRQKVFESDSARPPDRF